MRSWPLGLEVAVFEGQEEAGFIGFEKYEKSSLWEYPVASIVTDEWSLTGRACLRLTGAQTLKGRFTPKNQAGNYLVAGWFRTGNEKEMGVEFNCLQVKRGIDTFKAVILQRREEWIYAEAFIPAQTDSSTAIEIVVKSSSGALDIDHMRFSPEAGFYARTYDDNLQMKDSIAKDGSIKKFEFDPIGRPVAELKESGAIRSIKSLSKVTDGHISDLLMEPESGFFENFSPYAFQTRWTIANQEAWAIFPARLGHMGSGVDTIQLNPALIDANSAGVRFTLLKAMPQAYCELFLNGVKIQINDSSLTIDTKKIPLKQLDELILFSHSKDLRIWINGWLVFEEMLVSEIERGFSLTATGEISIDSFCLFNRPSLQLSYKNENGQVIQEKLLGDEGVVVSATLNDAAGRPYIQTNPCQIDAKLTFDPRFVTLSPTGELQGPAVAYIGKWGYQRAEYASNPLSQIQKRYLAGQNFNSHPTVQSSNPPIEIGDMTQFKGYQIESTFDSNGRKFFQVTDAAQRLVATYATAKGATYDFLKTAYSYDKDNVKVTPPEKARGEVFIDYDGEGRIVRITEPDVGTQYPIYHQAAGFCQFVIQLNRQGEFVHLLTFQSTPSGQIVESGVATEWDGIKAGGKPDDIEKWRKTLQELADQGKSIEKFTLLQQGRYQVNGLTGQGRGNDLIYQTQNASVVVEERLFYSVPGQLAKKWSSIDLLDRSDLVSYSYDGKGQVIGMVYPMRDLEITYQRDALGRITKILASNRAIPLAEIKYTPSGKIWKESHATFERKFNYNEPGYLTNISDPYLEEEISYTENGYGETGYFDGTVARTSFRHQWSRPIREDFFVANNIPLATSQKFIQLLIEGGYIDDAGHLLKAIPTIPLDLPNTWDEAAPYIRSKLNSLFPSKFSHQYGYGPHMQLSQAKYSVGEASGSLSPFGPDSFAIPIDKQKLWNALKPLNFIRDRDLNTIFKPLEKGKNSTNIQHLLAVYYMERKPLTKDQFCDHFVKWQGHVNGILIAGDKQAAATIFEEIKAIINRPEQIFSEALITACKGLENYLPDIIKVIYTYLFIEKIGLSDCDVNVYDIDANGNHQNYCAGSARTELSYSTPTNQPSKVNIDLTDYILKHDDVGNVSQAQHKKIKQIVYHPLSHRPTHIYMEDQTYLFLAYDRRGERVLKQRFNAQNELTAQVQYVRDEQGRLLVERRLDKEGKEVERAYIYGPRGLVGFMEDEEFFSILTDHLGSIRLVVKQDEVVAAFDYMPYGQQIRAVTAIDMRFRYAGQEWDEETGLYNFHARLYDPELGRFYQPDPKRQFASPYLYVGNSPVSMVDPDGEFAFGALAALFLGLLGAYLGASAANNSWDPTHWNWKSGKTWLGLGLGGLTGALAPVGFGASVGALAGVGMSMGTASTLTFLTGAGMGYLGMAAANHTMDPTKWQLKSPETWNALFQGFILGSSAAGGVSALKGLSLGSKLFSGGLGVTGAILGAASSHAGLDDPASWYDTIAGGVGGLLGGAGLAHSWRSINNITSLTRRVFAGSGGVLVLGGGGYVTTAATFDKWKPSDWDLTQPEVLNTLFGGLTSGFESHAIMVVGKRYLSRYEPIQIFSAGDCAFKAPLEIAKKQKLSLLQNVPDPEALRTIVGDEILHNLNDDAFKTRLMEDLVATALNENMRDHLPKSILDDLKKFQSETEIRDYFDNPEILKSYADAIKKGESWGGRFELDIIAKKYKLQFEIRMENGQWVQLGSSPDFVIRLQYERTGPLAHYNGSVRKNSFNFLPEVRPFNPLELDPLKGGTQFHEMHLDPTLQDLNDAKEMYKNHSLTQMLEKGIGRGTKLIYGKLNLTAAGWTMKFLLPKWRISPLQTGIN